MHLHQPVKLLHAKGFSIVEFMIAIAISLIILLAVAIAWQSGYKTQQSQAEVTRLNESVRFAMELLSREIRQAGLINRTTSPAYLGEVNFCATTNFGGSIVGVNDPGSINPAGAITSQQLPAGTTPIANLSDAIRVRYYGEDPTAAYAGTATATTEPTHDCLGYEVKPGEQVDDTLYVAVDPATGEPALYCHTSNTNAAAAGHSTLPMVPGIESLQILYGEYLQTAGPTAGTINQYVPWQLAKNNADNILSVKISIVARSASAVALDTGTVNKTFDHFGSSYVDPTGGTSPGTIFTPSGVNDKRLRLPPMSTEVSLRNFNNCS